MGNRFTQVRFTVAQKPKVVPGVIIAMRVPTRRMRQAQCNSLLLDFMSGCDGWNLCSHLSVMTQKAVTGGHGRGETCRVAGPSI